MSAPSPPATPARQPSDRAETTEGGSEFRTPGSRKLPTGQAPPPSTRKRRLAGAVETPAAKRQLRAKQAIDSDKDTHAWEPDVQRALEQAFVDGDMSSGGDHTGGNTGTADINVASMRSKSWVYDIIGTDLTLALVKAARIPTWSNIPAKDRNAFESILL